MYILSAALEQAGALRTLKPYATAEGISPVGALRGGVVPATLLSAGFTQARLARHSSTLAIIRLLPR